MQLPILKNLPDVVTRWKSILDPMLGRAYLNGQLLTGISLTNGTSTFNHKLGRKQQGWVITDQNAAASIYRSVDFNDLTLTLTSDAVVTVNLWVF